jgi:membrane-associated phospholipid phosphatase
MPIRTEPRALAVVAVIAAAGFAALTVAVTSASTLGIDASAFRVADTLRAPWLDHAAKAITTFGLFAIVGPAALACAGLLAWRGHRVRAAVLVVGVGIEWLCTQITKAAVDRPRPPAPLVHTSGASYPSGHAANSIAWLAFAIAVAAVIPTRGGRIAVIVAGALLAVLVGLSRVYLRAHYLSDVLAGEALSIAVYALAALAFGVWANRAT